MTNDSKENPANNITSYWKNIATVFSGNMLAQIVPLLMGPVIARVFTPTEFAVFDVYITIGGLFAVIACLRFEMAIMLPDTDEKALSIVRLNWRIALFMSAVSLFFVCIFNDYLVENSGSSDIIYFYWAVPLFVFGTGLYQSFYNYNSRIKSFKKVSASRVVQSTGVNTINVLINTIKSGSVGLILGHVLGLFVSVLVLFKKKYFIGPFVSFKNLFKEYREFPLVNAPHVFSDQLLQKFALTFLLLDQFSPEIVAFYALSNKYLKGPLRLITSSVSLVFYQKTAEENNQNQSSMSTLLKTSFMSLLLGIPMLFILLLFGEDLFAFVFGEEWRRAGMIASILIWSLFTNFLSSPISTIPIVKGKQKQAFLFGVIGQLFCLVLTYSFIKGWIFNGLSLYDGTVEMNALFVFSISSALYFLTLWFWYLKLSKEE